MSQINSTSAENIAGEAKQEEYRFVLDHTLGYSYSLAFGKLNQKIADLERQIEVLKDREEQEIFPIQFLDSEKLELQQPIIVRSVYSSQSNTCVVDHFELNIYGEGRDESEAVEDFKLSLEETYFDLKKDKEKLGPYLLKEWQILNKVIKEK